MANVFHNILVEAANEPQIPFDRFTDFNKLSMATAFIFKFINKFKRIRDPPDPEQSAKRYLMKIMQLQVHNKEIAYLKDCDSKEIPLLVKSLNVFIGANGILRVDSRIAYATRYEYDLVYLILIAKHHPLTRLIINDSHLKCKHLGIDTIVTRSKQSGYWFP